MNQNAWMKHPALANMDPLKLELIRTAAAQTSGKSGIKREYRDCCRRIGKSYRTGIQKQM